MVAVAGVHLESRVECSLADSKGLMGSPLHAAVNNNDLTAGTVFLGSSS